MGIMSQVRSSTYHGPFSMPSTPLFAEFCAATCKALHRPHGTFSTRVRRKNHEASFPDPVERLAPRSQYSYRDPYPSIRATRANKPCAMVTEDRFPK